MAAPIVGKERYLVVDVLRGFALLGILMVNMALFRNPLAAVLMGQTAGASLADQLADGFVMFFATRKFVSLFSFLFGLGMALMMGRVEGRGHSFVPMYLRRLLALLGFGALHAAFIWFGDILMLYAGLGLALLLMRHLSMRALRNWTIALLLIPPVGMGLLMWLASLVERLMGQNLLADQWGMMEQGYLPLLLKAEEIYQNGSFLAMVPVRVREVILINEAIVLEGQVLYLFALFLLGLQAGRLGLFQNLAEQTRLIKWTMGIGYAFGLPFSALAVVAESRIQSGIITYGGVYLTYVGQTFSGFFLCFAYIATICWLWQRGGWAERLAVLAPVGQMGLTNYLLQSVVCTFIFYGWGLGLIGQVGAATALALTLAIFGAQILLSHWWMKRFRFGPAEWVWRTVTYGKVQEMRKA